MICIAVPSGCKDTIIPPREGIIWQSSILANPSNWNEDEENPILAIK